MLGVGTRWCYRTATAAAAARSPWRFWTTVLRLVLSYRSASRLLSVLQPLAVYTYYAEIL